VSTGLFVAACVLLGGGPPEPGALLGAILVAGAWLLGVAVHAGGWDAVRRLPRPAQAVLAAFLLLPLVQLVPLPPAVWQALPGRALAAEVMAATGQADAWRPLTLDIGATLQSLALFVVLAGLFAASLVLTAGQVRQLFVLLLALAGVTVMLGLVQVVSRGEALLFYPNQHLGVLTGPFANKNHAGLFLAIAILALALILWRERHVSRRALTVAAPLLGVLLVAALITFSRAALMLCGLATAIGLLLVLGDRLRERAAAIGGAAVALAAGLAVVASTDLVGRSLGRFSDVATDDRWTFWRRSWPLLGTYWPTGAGLGSFTDLFPTIEPLSAVRPTYLNHVHNDYLEIVIETGLLGPALLAAAALVVGQATARHLRTLARTDSRLAVIGAAIVFLCALHSAFDYPLRRPAIAAPFFVALGLTQRRPAAPAAGPAGGANAVAAGE
jgi:O-antigen ligase